MRKRYQQGSLQQRKHGRAKVWVGLWRDRDGSRRYKTLGKCSLLSQSQAQAKLDELIRPLNLDSGGKRAPIDFSAFVDGIYIPYGRQRWKESTTMTTEQRIRTHLTGELGGRKTRELRREELQRLLDSKAAAGYSFSVVDHLRWDLRAIFEMAVDEGYVDRSPARRLYTPLSVKQSPAKRILAAEEVTKCLSVLDVRETLIVSLAIFSGMRPGEILGLKWGDIKPDHVTVRQRVYRGKVNTPKSTRSARVAALSPGVAAQFKNWRTVVADTSRDAWVFPSERGATPLWRDNVWVRHLEPQFKTVGLEWANFQVMRRTHSTLARRIGLDPKVVADQLGHGLGVNLDVYTQTGLDVKAEAVKRLEAAVFGLIGVNGVTVGKPEALTC